MIRALALGFTALLFLLAQSSWLAEFLPNYFKPELLLILVTYLCFTEPFIRGSLYAWLIGILLDSFGGTAFGLHATIYLGIFIIGRSSIRSLNTESPLLLMMIVFCGSLTESLLLALLGIFADLNTMLPYFAHRAMFQASINAIAAYLLLQLVAAIQRRLKPSLTIPGFAHLRGTPHGS